MRRSGREIVFRLRQEVENLRLWAAPPRFRGDAPAPVPGLPDPEAAAAALRGTAAGEQLRRLAETIRNGSIPVLGREVPRAGLAWRRDPASGRETPPRYFRRIPYLDFHRAGDHKIIWELNRHQWLVVLAQARRCWGGEDYDGLLRETLEDWWKENPYQCGINWASALEVAFRALSWIWIWHLAGEWMPRGFRGRFLESLFQHGRHLETNLSVYFSPNTHRLGEAVTLHALGALFAPFPPRWREQGRRLVEEQLRRQVRADGSHFEQSSYYHLYALDFFLLHAVLEKPGAEYLETLARMADYLEALAGPAGRLPFLGDDDGGRVFHPFGEREGFARATLVTCAAVLGRSAPFEDWAEQGLWWLGPAAPAVSGAPQEAEFFPDAGVAVMRAGDGQVFVDAGRFGWGSAGHSHAGVLGIVARTGREDLLLDPGTFTYMRDRAWRDWFRGTAAHSTIRLDGRDQATPAGIFRWTDLPGVRVRQWQSGAAEDYLDAACDWGGMVHRRQVWLRKPERVLLVADEVTGPGEHLVEQYWKVAGTHRPVLAAPDGFRVETGESWTSPVHGLKAPSPEVVCRGRARLPVRLGAAVRLGGEPGRLELAGEWLRWEGDGVNVEKRAWRH